MWASFSWFTLASKSDTKRVYRATRASSPGAQKAGADTTSSSFTVSSWYSFRSCSSPSSPRLGAKSGREAASSRMNCCAAAISAKHALCRGKGKHTVPSLVHQG